MNIRLTEIDDHLDVGALSYADPTLVAAVLSASKQMMEATSTRTPWVGYFAEVDGVVCGTCVFKGPPCNGRVEIAYFTFPGHESHGIATQMRGALLEIARCTDPSLQVFAQTLIDRNASHRVLEKLGFAKLSTFHHAEDGEILEWSYVLNG